MNIAIPRLTSDIKWWSVLVISLTLIVTLLGWLLGLVDQQLSHDLINKSSDFAWKGLRLGFYAGAVIAAGASVGRRNHPASLWAWITAFAVGVVLATGACGIAMYVLAKLSLLPDSDWLVGSPNRHALCRGLNQGFNLAGTLFPPVIALLLLRARFGPNQNSKQK